MLMMLSKFNAQFLVSGKLNGHPNSLVYVYIAEEGIMKFFKQKQTDTFSNFSVNFSKPYSGLILINVGEEKIRLLADNNDVNFEYSKQNPYKISSPKGINHQMVAYFKFQELNKVSMEMLPYIQSLYDDKSTFYKQIEEERKRLEKIPEVSIKNYPLLAYYISRKEELAKFDYDIIPKEEQKDIAKNRLVNDGISLLQTDFFGHYFEAYLSAGLKGAYNKEDVDSRILKSMDDLLKITLSNQQRRKIILSYAMSFFENIGFRKGLERYKTEAEKLKIDVNLSTMPLSEGENAPNIFFDKKIKNAKSLYEVKSKRKLLVFWSSYCSYCINEWENLKKFYPDFQKQGGEIIAFAVQFDNEYEKYTKHTDWINFSDLKEWDSPSVNAYKIRGTPTMFLLDENNKIIKVVNKINQL